MFASEKGGGSEGGECIGRMIGECDVCARVRVRAYNGNGKEHMEHIHREQVYIMEDLCV